MFYFLDSLLKFLLKKKMEKKEKRRKRENESPRGLFYDIKLN